jgi:hypothetical protein
MCAAEATDWLKEFGIEERQPPYFFASKDQLTRSSPQAYAIRRAFDLLGLDGVLCTDTSPLVYFKQVARITPEEVRLLHRKFWNHGSAPILVLIAKDKIYVYSGISQPTSAQETGVDPPSLVQTLERVSQGLREFLTSVETGTFFQHHARSFNPDDRVDRSLLRNLEDTRNILIAATERQVNVSVLDALLCRLVFTCYLFDRGVILPKYLDALGLRGMTHLRDVLAMKPTAGAKSALYKLFIQLQEDFNGDLFRDDLNGEARQITVRHVQTLSDFFQGTLVKSGQLAFWPYDFSAIPIETISAIYEHFLKTEDKRVGAFYTPRFLAEIALDTALEGFASLLDKRFLDPACGSGIFLVGLFNRIAEEWRQANPRAQNDRRARELMRLLQQNLFGADVNLTACRITAFSLYLAYLDQLTPRDVQELQSRGHALPRLISSAQDDGFDTISTKNIICADFFSKDADLPKSVDLVVGNPPWGSLATKETPASKWCEEHRKPLPDMQIAAAFVWKATEHLSEKGHVCFVLPHGVLFNHGSTAVAFQRAWLSEDTIRRVINLADFRRFLFEEAIHPALVVRYDRGAPENIHHTVEYWTPKVDWLATQAEVITVYPIDRSMLALGELLRDLDGPDAPQLWKQRLWATPRDLRLLDRLSLFTRLRDHVRTSSESESEKPWLIAEGFQPVGPNDDPNRARTLKLPSKSFIPARSPSIDLFLLPEDCDNLKSTSVTVRNKSNKNTQIYEAPHVLITKGFKRIAFADFNVSFRHAVRGLHGPKEHRQLLMFVAAYLRAPLAQYFMFHTSSSWGMYRPEGHVEEVLRLPLPLPEQQRDPKRCRAIVAEVAEIVASAARQAQANFIARSSAIQAASAKIEALVDEYFDIQPLEKILIEDTLSIVIPSIQPTHARMPVPTVQPTSARQRDAYKNRICETLSGWAKAGPYAVRGNTWASNNLGLGFIRLEKIRKSELPAEVPAHRDDLLLALDRLRKAALKNDTSVDPIHGLMVFDHNQIYILKPIAQRHWTQTAALNDADEIADTILMDSYRERA